MPDPLAELVLLEHLPRPQRWLGRHAAPSLRASTEEAKFAGREIVVTRFQCARVPGSRQRTKSLTSSSIAFTAAGQAQSWCAAGR
eukprot:scaffold38351_cov63-Phaeocystis_antarctica.AAC.16